MRKIAKNLIYDRSEKWKNCKKIVFFFSNFWYDILNFFHDFCTFLHFFDLSYIKNAKICKNQLKIWSKKCHFWPFFGHFWSKMGIFGLLSKKRGSYQKWGYFWSKKGCFFDQKNRGGCTPPTTPPMNILLGVFVEIVALRAKVLLKNKRIKKCEC